VFELVSQVTEALQEHNTPRERLDEEEQQVSVCVCVCMLVCSVNLYVNV